MCVNLYVSLLGRRSLLKENPKFETYCQYILGKKGKNKFELKGKRRRRRRKVYSFRGDYLFRTEREMCLQTLGITSYKTLIIPNALYGCI